MLHMNDLFGTVSPHCFYYLLLLIWYVSAQNFQNGLTIYKHQNVYRGCSELNDVLENNSLPCHLHSKNGSSFFVRPQVGHLKYTQNTPDGLIKTSLVLVYCALSYMAVPALGFTIRYAGDLMKRRCPPPDRFNHGSYQAKQVWQQFLSVICFEREARWRNHMTIMIFLFMLEIQGSGILLVPVKGNNIQLLCLPLLPLLHAASSFDSL